MTYYHIQGVPIWRYSLRFIVPIFIVLVAVLWARSCVRGLREDIHYSLLPLPNRGTRGFRDVTRYAMSDPAWAKTPMAGADGAVIEKGDSLVCAAMAFRMLGVEATPAELAAELGPEAFTETGEVIWGEALDWPPVKGKIDVSYDGLPDVETLEGAFGRRAAVILLVTDSRLDIPLWVFLVGRTPKSYLIVDPRTGKSLPLRLFGNRAKRMIVLQRSEE